MSSEKAGGGASAVQDGWLAGQVGPEKKRRQLVPDLMSERLLFSILGTPALTPQGFLVLPRAGLGSASYWY